MDDMDKDYYCFEREWQSADQEKQLALVTKAVDMPPGFGIIPVLAGISSFHFTVRNKARQNLNILQHKLNIILANASDNSAVLQSALFATRIYKKLHSNLSIQELRLYLGVLLESGGRCPFYAWKFCQSGAVSMLTLKNIISTIPEPGRLALVYQYTRATPTARRKNADHFKSLLKDIKDKRAVVAFYAKLFDMRVSVDPFWDNIPSRLRMPDGIIATELSSNNPEDRVNAVKALAMLSDKIDTALLLDRILADTESDVFMAGLSVIEVSSAGKYSELAEPLMKRVWNSPPSEAMAAFKALVAAGGVSLSTLELRVLKKNKSLVPLILEELSSFSSVTYTYIKALAEKPDIFLKYNKFFYQALVFAVVKKRPERVVRTLEKFIGHKNKKMAVAVGRLIQLLNESIELEKKEIRSQFDSLVIPEDSNEPQKEKKSFFKSFFKSETNLSEKLYRLKEATSSDVIAFEGDTIDRVDLSSSVFLSPGIFNGSMVKNSDFSNSTFEYFYFQGAFIYNVDFTGAKFTSVSFDDAVFYNITADETRFLNCSFSGASFYNCSFESAVMEECIFAGAVISRTSFKGATLSGSTFAASDLSLISFSASNLVGTDFSALSALFTRFPTHSMTHVEMENADLNSRLFQFSMKELFDELTLISTDKEIVHALNKLLYTELVQHGRKMFLRKNRVSVLTAFDYFRPDQADMFEIIPMLLHENIDLIKPSIRHGLPERQHFMAEENDAPHGIAEYIPGYEIEILCREYMKKGFLKKDGLLFMARKNCFIESVFTMGSIGSIAQSLDSDIDYWICIRKEKFDDDAMQRFRKKLQKIESWALDEFGTEIHFFLVNIDDAVRNDFGHSDSESSGSAQGRLLKEEFYRTMIHVAGKLPFWCTLPSSVSINHYDSIFQTLCPVHDDCRYLNLGDIHDISPGEFFGASIWQMFKLLKSPFKSVLKMGLLEKYVRTKENRVLLCNRFKDEWMSPGLHFGMIKNDSYYILLKTLVNYYKSEMDHQSRNLVPLCFFLKLGIEKESEFENTLFGLRSILIRKCMDEWQWHMADVLDVGSFRGWSYAKIAQLSHKIEQYMQKTYRKVSAHLVAEEEALITPNDRTILGRKMIVEFDKNKPNKIEKVLLVSRSDNHFQGLWLQYKQLGRRRSLWELFYKSGEKGKYVDESLKKARTIEEIGAWLVNNKLFSANTMINLVPNPTFVRANDIKSLFAAMQAFFEADVKKDIDSEVMLSKAVITSIFISMNLCVSRIEKNIMECSAVYLNSWGEMFCHSFASSRGFSSKRELIVQLKRAIGTENFPKNNHFFFPQR